jgi:hypothetical protein
MKNLFMLLVVIVLSPVLLYAQSSDPELDYIKKAYSKDKKTIVDEYMGLDVQDGGKFWPIYSAYEAKREKLATERLKMIEEYINLSDGITDAQADKTANAALTNTISLSKLNLEYYGKVKKAVGAVRAAKFMQLETYLQTAWRAYVQNNIPLIGELDKTQKD